MVAYSFQRRFVVPIRSGVKRHTIRADRKRHARPGEDLQLYTGMRTKRCELIAYAVCRDVLPITIIMDDAGARDAVLVPDLAFANLDHFAMMDGFADWADLKAFWREQHPGIDEFTGVMIRWGDIG